MRIPGEESRHHETLQDGVHCDGVNHSRGVDEHDDGERLAQEKVLTGNVDGSGVVETVAGGTLYALGGHDFNVVLSMTPTAAAGGTNKALVGHEQGVDESMAQREVVEFENVDRSEVAREKAAVKRKASVHRRKLEVLFCEIVSVSLRCNCP